MNKLNHMFLLCLILLLYGCGGGGGGGGTSPSTENTNCKYTVEHQDNNGDGQIDIVKQYQYDNNGNTTNISTDLDNNGIVDKEEITGYIDDRKVSEKTVLRGNTVYQATYTHLTSEDFYKVTKTSTSGKTIHIYDFDGNLLEYYLYGNDSFFVAKNIYAYNKDRLVKNIEYLDGNEVPSNVTYNIYSESGEFIRQEKDFGNNGIIDETFDMENIIPVTPETSGYTKSSKSVFPSIDKETIYTTWKHNGETYATDVEYKEFNLSGRIIKSSKDKYNDGTIDFITNYLNYTCFN